MTVISVGVVVIAVMVTAVSPKGAFGQVQPDPGVCSEQPLSPEDTPSDKPLVMAEDFSHGLDDWQRQRLDRRETRYAVVLAGTDHVLASTSVDAASALVRSIPCGSVADATVAWRWQVERSLSENRSERSSEGDDYAARILVLFGDGELSDDTRAIAYTWSGREPVGSIYPNPNLEQVRTIVLRSGDDDAGRWVREERDLSADYRAAFGSEPPPVTAIAIVVDTDDTKSRATAWFDDVEVRGYPTGVRRDGGSR